MRRPEWFIVAGIVAGLVPEMASAQTYTPHTTTGVSPWPPSYRAGVSTSPFAPNFYNRQSQPLSPYLNLFRGVDPATNYYYGARPGLPTGNPQVTTAMPLAPLASQLRTGFLPAGANPTQEPTELPASGLPIDSLPPAGHPVIYGGGPGRSPYASRPGVFSIKPPAAYSRKSGRTR